MPGLTGMKTFTALAALLAAAALAGCGGTDDTDQGAGGTTTAPQTSGIAVGPGISIEEAIALGSDEPVLVNGNLLADGGDVLLCYALAESFPPQCGGPSVQVVGLKLAEVDGLVTEGEVSWTDRPIQLLGVVDDETLTVSENAL
jgi:hypothetical protein